MKTQIPYASTPLTLNGGQSNITYCFAKTDCTGSNRGSGKYQRMYYNTSQTELDFIMMHTWYTEGNYQTVTALTSGSDKGAQQGNKVVIFDMNDDNIVTDSTAIANGWSLAYDSSLEQFGAFNTTSANYSNIQFSANVSTSFFVDVDDSGNTSYLTLNTMGDPDKDGYDTPQKIQITYTYSGKGNYTVSLNGVNQTSTNSGNSISFNATTGQNGNIYVITAATSAAEEGDVTIGGNPLFDIIKNWFWS
jgi:hypothetical protein